MLVTRKLTHGLLIVRELTTYKPRALFTLTCPQIVVEPIVLCAFLKFWLVCSDKYSEKCRKTFYSYLFFCDMFCAIPAGIIEECPPPSIAP